MQSDPTDFAVRLRTFLAYVLSTVPGWCLIAAFLYVYGFRQRGLVKDELLLFAILAIGVVLSFVCSSVEMALAHFDDKQLATLSDLGKDNLNRRNTNTISQEEFLVAQRNISDIMLLYYRRERLNAPIVIFNNMVNTAIASLLPLALLSSPGAGTPPTLPFGNHPIPFGGDEMFTFALTIISLVLFGEVIPKKLGMKYSLGFLRCFIHVIKVTDTIFWPLSRAFLSVVEIPSKLRQLVLGLPIE